MEYPMVFGILLVATAGSSLACGLYAVQNNIKTPINRIFLALACAMVFWCLGLAITAVAANEEISALGRRLAPLGWGTICSILLHFILRLTQKHYLLKKWWLYLLLYLPSAVSVFAYTYLPLIGLNQDRLIRNELGWLNIAKTDGWDWFYYGYYLSFISLSLLILYLWAKKSPSANIKKQVSLLILSSLAATLLGSCTDVLPIFLGIRIPQFSPIFILFIIAAISYSVKHYGFMQPEPGNQNELILNKSAYTNVYRYIGLIFATGSLLHLAVRLLSAKGPLPLSAYLFSGFLLAITFFVFFIKKINLDDSLKEMLLAVSFSFIIPTVTLWFSYSGGATIWAFIFLLLIVCLLFNRYTLLLTVIFSSLLAQLLLWAAVPSVTLTIGGKDYLVRILLIGLAALSSSYVNKLYVQRLKDNAHQIRIQMLVSETSHDFVSANEQNFADKIQDMLKRCGSFVCSDRAFMALLDPCTQQIRHSFEWRRDGSGPQQAAFENNGSELSQLLLKYFETFPILNLGDTALMPWAEDLKDQLSSRDIGAFLALPIKKQEAVIGFLIFTANRPLKEWQTGSFIYLDIITNIVADAIIKIEAEREINFIAYHDQLTLLPNRILLKSKLEKAIRHAETTGKMVVVVFLDLDSFKFVNDTMGHELGDRLLFEAAQLLARNIRSNDAVARFGGDEFVILLNDITSKKDAAMLAEKIINTLRSPFILNGRQFFTSASAGVALYPQDGTDCETLIKNADLAMYSAKLRGKNQYAFCSDPPLMACEPAAATGNSGQPFNC